ncbi:hypothetical protein CHLRE_12g539204v5 [Chlamydomonas reinhardtii]|uniref:Uncharacterized protein n=1 Tax=Chlamydomonas reinhardtii TaxID=3055 RepID=A0A2K3D5E3_CHLRE|nr:uncharacterized protein CHLRE_12g539204v5 [Chlamydomonas reinhardtii]PNW75750.1 hypothetical protein CHLRE_12g539204v5 [Chlamydomonas reinhardtii]
MQLLGDPEGEQLSSAGVREVTSAALSVLDTMCRQGNQPQLLQGHSLHSTTQQAGDSGPQPAAQSRLAEREAEWQRAAAQLTTTAAQHFHNNPVALDPWLHRTSAAAGLQNTPARELQSYASPSQQSAYAQARTWLQQLWACVAPQAAAPPVTDAGFMLGDRMGMWASGPRGAGALLWSTLRATFLYAVWCAYWSREPAKQTSEHVVREVVSELRRVMQLRFTAATLTPETLSALPTQLLTAQLKAAKLEHFVAIWSAGGALCEVEEVQGRPSRTFAGLAFSRRATSASKAAFTAELMRKSPLAVPLQRGQAVLTVHVPVDTRPIIPGTYTVTVKMAGGYPTTSDPSNLACAYVVSEQCAKSVGPKGEPQAPAGQGITNHIFACVRGPIWDPQLSHLHCAKFEMPGEEPMQVEVRGAPQAAGTATTAAAGSPAPAAAGVADLGGNTLGGGMPAAAMATAADIVDHVGDVQMQEAVTHHSLPSHDACPPSNPPAVADGRAQTAALPEL